MPGLNGKGPKGEGPSTGRGLGNCRPGRGGNTSVKSNEERNDQERGMGMGFRRRFRGEGQGGLNKGRGFGRGFGRGQQS